MKTGILLTSSLLLLTLIFSCNPGMPFSNLGSSSSNDTDTIIYRYPITYSDITLYTNSSYTNRVTPIHEKIESDLIRQYKYPQYLFNTTPDTLWITSHLWRSEKFPGTSFDRVYTDTVTYGIITNDTITMFVDTSMKEVWEQYPLKEYHEHILFHSFKSDEVKSYTAQKFWIRLEFNYGDVEWDIYFDKDTLSGTGNADVTTPIPLTSEGSFELHYTQTWRDSSLIGTKWEDSLDEKTKTVFIQDIIKFGQQYSDDSYRISYSELPQLKVYL